MICIFYDINQLEEINITTLTSHPRKYGKIDENIDPSALQLVGNWINQTAQ
jgi:hypothetical protein